MVPGGPKMLETMIYKQLTVASAFISRKQFIQCASMDQNVAAQILSTRPGARSHTVIRNEYRKWSLKFPQTRFF